MAGARAQSALPAPVPAAAQSMRQAHGPFAATDDNEYVNVTCSVHVNAMCNITQKGIALIHLDLVGAMTGVHCEA